MADDGNPTAASDGGGNTAASDGGGNTAVPDGRGNEQTTEPVPRCLVLGSLADWDEAISSRLAVCSSPSATWGRARPLMKLLEHTGNDPPWIVGLGIAIAMARSAEARLTFFNLLFLLVFDTAVLLSLKAIFQRPRPRQNLGDHMTLLSDIYSFPSGHATRAVAATTFIICQFDCSMVSILLLVTWSVCCCASRVLLARHHVLDVIAGMVIGSLEYLVFLWYLWLSPDSKVGKYLKM